MSKELFADPDKCTGCNRCSYVCSATKTGAFAPSASRIKINNYPHRGYSVPSICFHCPGAACQKACPSGAISRSEQNVVTVDAALCTACGSCMAACPYGMIEVPAGGTACKCDYCSGDPACVKECYAKALAFAEKTPELIRLKGVQMKQRSSEGQPETKRNNLGNALVALARD